jgi:hypothetical protein
MKETIKITAHVGIVFLISFGILFFILDVNEDIIATEQIENIKKLDDTSIFLLGTSYVGQLNSTHIEKNLEKYLNNVTVYNIENMRISQTFEKIDKIIANEPSIVVYGIGFRDIGFMEGEQCKLDTIPKFEMNVKIDSDSNYNDTQNITNIFSHNPKQITIRIIENIVGEYEIINTKKTKEIGYGIKLYEARAIDKIKDIGFMNKGNPQTYCMEFDLRDRELISLDKIFSKFKENSIEVIVFMTPHTKGFLDKLSPELKLELSSNIHAITKKYDFSFHNLSAEFQHYNIFSDYTHVAYNPKSAMYSEKIVEIINSYLSKNGINLNKNDG